MRGDGFACGWLVKSGNEWFVVSNDCDCVRAWPKKHTHMWKRLIPKLIPNASF